MRGEAFDGWMVRAMMVFMTVFAVAVGLALTVGLWVLIWRDLVGMVCRAS